MNRDLQAKVYPISKGHWFLQPRPSSTKANFVYWAYACTQENEKTHSWTIFFFFDEEPDGSKDYYTCKIGFVAPDAPVELQEPCKKIDLFVGINELVGHMEIV